MTIFTFANNVSTTLAGPVSSSATTITLSSTANLPATIPSGQVLVITLNDVATRQNFEVVYATARTGSTLTVLRGQEGTAALSWLTGDYAYSPPTAGQQASFGQLAGSNTWTGSDTFNNPVTVAAATSAGHAVNLGQFSGLLSSTGYFEVPLMVGGTLRSGLIQFGTGVSNSSGIATLPLPVDFPTGFSAIANYINSGTGVTNNVTASISTASTLSQLVAVVQANNSPINAAQVSFIAVGY